MLESYRKPLGMMLQRSILPGDQPDFGLPTVPSPNVPMPQKKGLFAQGSKGQMIAGIIGDTLASLSGGDPIFTMNMMRQREMGQRQEAEEAQWTRRREAERADKQWEWANKPKETQGTSLQQNYEYLKRINPAAAESYLKSQTSAPPVVVTNPDGTKTLYPAGAIPQSAAPATLPPDFDFGDEGGPASAPGGFPY